MNEMNENVTVLNMPPMGERARLLDRARELVVSAKEESADAFDQTGRTLSLKTFRVACNITRQYHDAEDVIQTAFLNPSVEGDTIKTSKQRAETCIRA